jgi:integrase
VNIGIPLRPSRPAAPLPPLRSARLLDQVRERIHYLHYSIRTEDAYVHWIRAFVFFHGRRHPGEMGGPEVEAFLSWLANERIVAVSTHRQALSALLFLYQKVLGLSLPWMEAIGRPRREPRLPVVLSVDEVTRILALLQGEQRLLAQLLYGTGMRNTEGLQLRVKDVDFEQRTIVIRAGKGGKDRSVMLPLTLVHALRDQLARARVLWTTDGEAGRIGSQVSPRRHVVGMVLGVSTGRSFCRSALGCSAQAPYVRPDLQARRRARRREQTGHAAHAASFLCHAPAAGGLRHT